MKILNTVEELWSHCLFCPVCQGDTRTMLIDVGPDDAFKLIKFEKDGDQLTLYCRFKAVKRYHDVKYIINCLDNSFSTVISEPQESKDCPTTVSRPYFYFYVQSECYKCKNSHCNGTDLELDMLNSKITNIGLERESVKLIRNNIEYYIQYMFDYDKLFLSKQNKDESRPSMECPIFDLGFPNIDKVISRINTILVFS